MSGVANLILMGGRRRACLADVTNFQTPVSKGQVRTIHPLVSSHTFVFGPSL